MRIAVRQLRQLSDYDASDEELFGKEYIQTLLQVAHLARKMENPEGAVMSAKMEKALAETMKAPERQVTFEEYVDLLYDILGLYFKEGLDALGLYPKLSDHLKNLVVDDAYFERYKTLVGNGKINPAEAPFTST